MQLIQTVAMAEFPLQIGISRLRKAERSFLIHVMRKVFSIIRKVCINSELRRFYAERRSYGVLAVSSQIMYREVTTKITHSELKIGL